MRIPGGLVLAASAFASAAPAPAAADPAADFAAGSAPTQAAVEVSRAYWQADPCAGQVSIVWMALLDNTNATSSWTNPVGQYDAPAQNANCQIAFNSSLAWDWDALLLRRRPRVRAPVGQLARRRRHP